MDELTRKVKALFDEYHFPGHDFKHAQRTQTLARIIAEAEGYDAHEAEVAGLLHDVGRTVKNPQGTHAHIGVPIAKELLDTYDGLTQDAKERILKAVELHSDPTTEGKLNNILQDADKLDGMGAVGISRAYISHFDKPDYLPNDVNPKGGDYYNIQTIHESIALQTDWYNMLYTPKAKDLGKPRYEFMKAFMLEFVREVEELK